VRDERVESQCGCRHRCRRWRRRLARHCRRPISGSGRSSTLASRATRQGGQRHQEGADRESLPVLSGHVPSITQTHNVASSHLPRTSYRLRHPETRRFKDARAHSWRSMTDPAPRRRAGDGFGKATCVARTDCHWPRSVWRGEPSRRSARGPSWHMVSQHYNPPSCPARAGRRSPT
jgi:hypothetical protein